MSADIRKVAVTDHYTGDAVDKYLRIAENFLFLVDDTQNIEECGTFNVEKSLLHGGILDDGKGRNKSRCLCPHKRLICIYISICRADDRLEMIIELIIIQHFHYPSGKLNFILIKHGIIFLGSGSELKAVLPAYGHIDYSFQCRSIFRAATLMPMV